MMRDDSYTNIAIAEALYFFAHPEAFDEHILKSAIIAVWPLLSSVFKLGRLDGSTQAKGIRPDLVARDEYNKDQWMLLELKQLSHPSGGKESAKRQITNYALRFLEYYPDRTVWPIIIGPYVEEDFVWDDGVTFLSLNFLCQYVLAATIP
jgi:hypothetical protein